MSHELARSFVKRCSFTQDLANFVEWGHKINFSNLPSINKNIPVKKLINSHFVVNELSDITFNQLMFGVTKIDKKYFTRNVF
jgi:predicted transcriptional regulator